MEVSFKLGPRIPRVGLNNRRLLPIPLRSELEKLYSSGLSTRQLVAVYGVSRGIIRGWMNFYEIPRRTGVDMARNISRTLKAKGIKPSNKAHDKQHEIYGKYFVTPEMNDEIPTLYAEGLTLGQLAQRFSLDKSTIYRILLRNGVKCRTASERSKILWSNPEWAAKQVRLVKAIWEDPERRSKLIAAVLKGLKRRPTQPEQRVIKIIQQYKLPYKYTGDGSFIVAGLNPDFVNCNGRKIALEVFGDHWHREIPYGFHQTEEGRKAKFAEYGWSLVVLWEGEMKQLTDDEIVNRITIAESKQKEEVLCHKSVS